MGNYTGSVPDTAPRRLDWQAEALCRSTGSGVFFDGRREAEARRVCFACPVLVACQSWVMGVERGLSLYHRDGVVAALTPQERVDLDPSVPKPLPAADKPKPAGKRKKHEHGTRGCYKAGCRREECKAAARAYTQELQQRKERGEQVRSGAGRKRAECPSVSAYRRHLRLGEPVDDGCRAAYAKERARRRADKQARRVYVLWAKGLSDPEIAERLGVGVRAVRNARGRLGLIPNLHVRRAS